MANEKYDLMNDIMSFGIHRLWKKYYSELLEKFHKPSENILDVASGTGDIFFLLNRKKNLFALDPISEMHLKSKDKNQKKNINYKIGYAEKMPYKKNFFQIISCTYGVRNFQNKLKSFKEINRCLKKDGYFLFMEFGNPNKKIFSSSFNFYLENFLPFLGSLIAKDRRSYQYLADSIQKFPNEKSIIKLAKSANLYHEKTIHFLSGANSIYIFKKL